MSDQSGVTDGSPTSAAVVQNETVPKYRLDEVLAERRQLAEQNAVLADLLRQARPQAAGQQPQEEPPHWKQMKEDNPALYNELKRLSLENKRHSATNFQIMDQLDQNKFLQEFGDKGAKELLPVVEQKLNELRTRGIHHFNRGQIFVHLKGVEAIQTPRSQPQAQQQQQVQQTQQQVSPIAQALQNVPGTDPSAAGTTTGGSAAVSNVPETLEEKEKRLANIVF